MRYLSTEPGRARRRDGITGPDLIVLFEHPEWQEPLFSALELRGVSYESLDLKRGAFDPDGVPDAPLYFNQASPSA